MNEPVACIVCKLGFASDVVMKRHLVDSHSASEVADALFGPESIELVADELNSGPIICNMEHEEKPSSLYDACDAKTCHESKLSIPREDGFVDSPILDLNISSKVGFNHWHNIATSTVKYEIYDPPKVIDCESKGPRSPDETTDSDNVLKENHNSASEANVADGILSCQTVIASSDDLDVHLQHIRRRDVEKHNCKLCSYSTNFLGDLYRHVMCHDVARSFKCEKCDASFSTRHKLRQHVVIHSDARPFGCKLCNKSFKLKSNLTHHRHVHNPPRFACNVCGRKFVRSNSLKDHITTHGRMRYKCRYCQREFAYRSNAKKHETIAHFDSSVQ